MAAAAAAAAAAAHAPEGDDVAVEGLACSEFGEVILAERALTSLPAAAVSGAAEFDPAAVKLLNLTENRMASGAHLDKLPNLETLILDKNGLAGIGWCCPIPSLKTLYVNNNDISDATQFVGDVARLFPSLEYLSMMRNPCCPEFFNITESRQEDYRRHREFVLSQLPTLQFLDATEVTDEERGKAARRGAFLGNKARPTPKKQTAEQSEAVAAQQAYEAARKRKKDAARRRSRPSTFLGLGSNERYDGSHSEGNRFITDSDL